MTAPRDPATTISATLLDEHRSSPGLLLALLGQEAMRRLRAGHTAHNLKPRQFQMLRLLHDHGGLAPRDLMETMRVDPSILVTLLNPLEADGLVAREREPAERVGWVRRGNRTTPAAVVFMHDRSNDSGRR